VTHLKRASACRIRNPVNTSRKTRGTAIPGCAPCTTQSNHHNPTTTHLPKKYLLNFPILWQHFPYRLRPLIRKLVRPEVHLA
jgi:hypothetical protein